MGAATLVAAPAFFFLARPPALTAATPEPRTHLVHIQGMLFRPEVVTISPGDSVTWINDDILLHAMKSTGPHQPWQSADLPQHATWRRQFQTGADYVCPYHPTMIGRIVLVEGEPPSEREKP